MVDYTGVLHALSDKDAGSGDLYSITPADWNKTSPIALNFTTIPEYDPNGQLFSFFGLPYECVERIRIFINKIYKFVMV